MDEITAQDGQQPAMSGGWGETLAKLSADDEPSSEPKRFSVNAVIDAYAHGRESGRKEVAEGVQALIEEKFQDNLRKANELAAAILKALDEKGFSVVDVFMRALDYDDFELMIVVPEDDFVRDEFDTLYSQVRELHQSFQSQTFRSDSRFLPVPSEEKEGADRYKFNVQALYGDRYYFHLKSHLNEQGPRPTQ